LHKKENNFCQQQFGKVAVQYSEDTFKVNKSLVLRIKIGVENRQLRQARKR
jgi:hypothetical protein